MIDTQQGDVLLFQTNDEGEITSLDGVVSMSGGGLETAVYTSLFGANEDDDGREKSTRTWWGNVEEPVEVRKVKSETQFLLKGLPVTTSNLSKIEDAVVRDLGWMLETSTASSIDVTVSLIGINRIQIDITIEANGLEQKFNFTQNWKALP